MSRPTSLTPELQETLARDIEAGASLETAAALAGIAPSTLYAWRKRGREGEEPYSEFLEVSTRARARARMEAIKAVRAGCTASGLPDWRAAAWWLERMEPAEFGRTAAVNAIVRTELESAVDRLLAVLPAAHHEDALRALGAGEEGRFASRDGGPTLRIEVVKPERPNVSICYSDGAELTQEEKDALAEFRARRGAGQAYSPSQERERR